MANFAPHNLFLRLDPQNVEFDPFEPNINIVQWRRAKIMAYDADKEKNFKLGEIQFVTVDTGLALNTGVSLFDACDADSDTMNALEQMLFKESEEFRANVQKALGDDAYSGNGLVYVREIKLKPKYRGNNLGLAALYTLVHHALTGFSNFVLEAYPLPVEGEPEMPKAVRTRVASKLRKHYAQIGFKRIGNTDWMGLSSVYRQPPLPVKE